MKIIVTRDENNSNKKYSKVDNTKFYYEFDINTNIYNVS